jgi:hypothetical protein
MAWYSVPQYIPHIIFASPKTRLKLTIVSSAGKHKLFISQVATRKFYYHARSCFEGAGVCTPPRPWTKFYGL